MKGSSNKSIKASIIIPSYNAGGTLKRALDSALSQTERSIEVIVVDDGSTDNTAEIAKTYAAKDSRVKYLQMPKNGGKPDAMNYASSQARGDWIALLDSDDWYEPTRIEKLVSAGEESGVGLVADNIAYYDHHAGKVARLAFNDPKPIEIDLDKFLENSAPLESFDYGILKPVFRASFWRGHGLAYEPACRNGHDWYLLLDFFMAGGKALVIEEVLYVYVQPYGSISRKWATEKPKPYLYEIFYNNNRLFLKKYRDRLNPTQLKHLTRRGDMFLMLAHWQKIKKSLSEGRVAEIAKTVLSTPLVAWKYLPKKISVKLRGL